MANPFIPPSPDQLFGALFHDVQLGHVFPDSKTFVDCVPKLAPTDLLALYETEKSKPGFDLKEFVHQQFRLPNEATKDLTNGNYVSDTTG